MFTQVEIKKQPKTEEERRRAGQVDYQQGFSPEGAALLSRPWVLTKPISERFE